MDQLTDRMTRPERLAHARRMAGLPPKRIDRAVSWSDFRTAVRFDPANRMLLAVPAISAKRAEHPWLGEAVTVHTRTGETDVYRREYEHGSVYWSERTGAHEVHGGIEVRWLESGGTASFLGLPTTDERPLFGERGRTDGAGGTRGGYSHFEGGSVYWTDRHGVAIVHGMVRDIWALLGWDRSPLGLPVADVTVEPATGAMSGCFEHGTITWSPAGGPEVTVASTVGGDPLDESQRVVIDRLQSGFAPGA